VRHAGDATLDQLENLLADLRTIPGLKEKKRGTFYRGPRAFLHFHEDPMGLFADVRLEVDFERVRVTTAREQKALLTTVRRTLG
jgi:hypothetical protein